MPKIIWIKLISQYHNNLFAGTFDINKTIKVIGWKYYLLNLKEDVEAFVKGNNICLDLKIISYKPYSDLQLLPIPIY